MITEAVLRTAVAVLLPVLALTVSCGQGGGGVQPSPRTQTTQETP